MSADTANSTNENRAICDVYSKMYMYVCEGARTARPASASRFDARPTHVRLRRSCTPILAPPADDDDDDGESTTSAPPRTPPSRVYYFNTRAQHSCVRRSCRRYAVIWSPPSAYFCCPSLRYAARPNLQTSYIDVERYSVDRLPFPHLVRPAARPPTLPAGILYLVKMMHR